MKTKKVNPSTLKQGDKIALYSVYAPHDRFEAEIITIHTSKSPFTGVNVTTVNYMDKGFRQHAQFHAKLNNLPAEKADLIIETCEATVTPNGLIFNL